MTMIKIIGCGNILRHDDGVGVYVINELKKMPLAKDVELIDAGTRGLDIVSFLEGAQKVIIVDAVKSKAEPGTVYRFDIDENKIRQTQVRSISTHEFNWENVLAIGSRIYGDAFPKQIVFFGIEIENIEPSLGLSSAINESLPKVVKLILEELKNGKTKLLGS